LFLLSGDSPFSAAQQRTNAAPGEETSSVFRENTVAARAYRPAQPRKQKAPEKQGRERAKWILQNKKSLQSALYIKKPPKSCLD